MPEHQQTHQSTESKSTSQKQAIPRIPTPVSHPMAIIQRARINPKSLTHADVMQLQRTIGNRAVVRLLSEIGAIPSKAKQAPPVQRQELVQRQEIPEEEEPLQGKFESGHEKETCPACMQRQEIPEEEEPLQGKFENKPEICPSCFAAPIVQRQEIPEEEEPLQGKFETVQRQEIPEEEEPLQTKSENNTGMPDNLKAGVENLSGIDMSDVRVHYNSSNPAEVGALAYTQGTNIHVAPGQEKHLPHEAWHVVQQAQGRVKPTIQLKDGVQVNDDEGLENEADVVGKKAMQLKVFDARVNPFAHELKQLKISTLVSQTVIQRVTTPDLANSLLNINYINGVGLPGLVNTMTDLHGRYHAKLANYQMINGPVDPPAGHELDTAAGGLYRFTERMIEQIDGGWAEVGEADRLATKPNLTPALGIPGQAPDISYQKLGGSTGIEAKAINSDNVGTVNTRILEADGQLGQYVLARRKIHIWIAHPNNHWPGVIGWVARNSDLLLQTDIATQLNGMAIVHAQKITILDINVNYDMGSKEVVAERIPGVVGWNVNVL
ncbi:MAG: hypothetical protein QG646_3935 [Euryarchaeota archaeon]|nr:hypothetical protein [Euryarchaeota archaeon]